VSVSGSGTSLIVVVTRPAYADYTTQSVTTIDAQNEQ